MRNSWRFGRNATVAAILISLAAGCSTVVGSADSEERRIAAVERETLLSAASAVTSTKWPKPEAASWGARLAGLAGDDARLSEDDAVAAYIASLGAPPRKADVLADAARHIEAAHALHRAAANAAEAVRPAMADVAVVEAAIGSLRQTRDIYLASLKALAREGETVSPAEIRSLKDGFAEAIELLGAAADDLAEAIDEDETRTFASPAVSKFVN